MGEQPVQMNFSLLAYFQFLSASPVLKVGLVGFLFVADVLTRTGIILSEGFGLPLFERSLEGWMFRLSAYLILSYTLPDQEIHLSPFYINNRDCSHTIWHFKSIAATQAKGSGSLGKEKFLLTN